MTPAAAKGRPLLRLEKVVRSYQSGEQTIRALNEVGLEIYPGEFVAVMGQSGSGKSTLMNILGCLDWPSSGDYWVNGENVKGKDADELARLRRETFGFIFQRYNLMATATAEENVEIPAIYAGKPRARRMARAVELLGKLGLKGREGHRPNQLSGGQQQRVAVARALMNDPPVILADEPTGALDSKSGEEVMKLLGDLHGEGRTIILITHDAQVAAHAHRLVRISDGRIVSDEVTSKGRAAKPVQAHPREEEGMALPGFGEAAKMAMRALKVNIFRTSLTLLGIVIGVASVVTMLAVGNGSKQNVLDQISAVGTNLLSVRPGAPGIRGSGDIITLTQADARAVEGLDNISVAEGERSGRFTLRYGNTDYQSTVTGTGPGFTMARNWAVAEGSFFTDRDVAGYAPVAVIGKTVAGILFPYGVEPVGQYIQVGNVPFQVIGVMAEKGAGFGGQDQDDVVLIPLSTGQVRLFGGNYVNAITAYVTDISKIDDTQAAIEDLLKARHRQEDFSVRSMASILQTATAMQNTLTMLLGTVAAISLLVGGIGVMNIMLVNVTERTREIGVRMATGARTFDILLQFITEAAVVCTLGGVMGVVLGVATGLALKLFGVAIVFTLPPVVLAFGCAVATGLVFGYLPARQAAQLSPVVALASE
ncbi:MAG: MacB family efflux pump subunit [Proteobacteria bacterium]|nr:MacB family efflux pump subunit [Pseudomonadota bacterium]